MSELDFQFVFTRLDKNKDNSLDISEISPKDVEKVVDDFAAEQQNSALVLALILTVIFGLPMNSILAPSFRWLLFFYVTYAVIITIFALSFFKHCNDGLERLEYLRGYYKLSSINTHFLLWVFMYVFAAVILADQILVLISAILVDDGNAPLSLKPVVTNAIDVCLTLFFLLFTMISHNRLAKLRNRICGIEKMGKWIKDGKQALKNFDNQIIELRARARNPSEAT